jgi:TRAP-type C4-dicarboxylate transport system permease small subunit
VVELSEYSLLAIAMLCAPWVYKKDFNLKVDILLMNRSVRFKEIHSYIVNFIILVSSLIVFYYGSLSLMDSIERDRYIFKMLVFPEWYINWIIPFSMFMVSSEAIFKLFSYNKNREA